MVCDGLPPFLNPSAYRFDYWHDIFVRMTDDDGKDTEARLSELRQWGTQVVARSRTPGRPAIPAKLRKQVARLLEHGDGLLHAFARQTGAASAVRPAKKKYTNGLH